MGDRWSFKMIKRVLIISFEGKISMIKSNGMKISFVFWMRIVIIIFVAVPLI